MQGTLNEIDIRSILELIELGQRTGELMVNCQGSSWFIFFINGKIVYGTEGDQASLVRLQDYLRHYKVEDLDFHSLTSLDDNTPLEYAYLWQLLKKRILNPAQCSEILESLIQETLFDLFSLLQGTFIFKQDAALAPQLITLEIRPLVAKISSQVQQWKEFHPQIYHPEQRFLIANQEKLQTKFPQLAYQQLLRWSYKNASLRQVARYLNRDLAAIARTLYPYVERGWLQMLSPTGSKPSQASPNTLSSSQKNVFRIVCLDDDLAIGSTIEQLLSLQGYEATALSDPVAALKELFHIQPDLIFCDIGMPNLNGNELCAMLRHSTLFRHTPIIMLTGKEGFLERTESKMVGATDYLTKPFAANELLLLLEKYLPSQSQDI